MSDTAVTRPLDSEALVWLLNTVQAKRGYDIPLPVLRAIASDLQEAGVTFSLKVRDGWYSLDLEPQLSHGDVLDQHNKHEATYIGPLSEADRKNIKETE